MDAPTKPSFEATISPLLVDLLAGPKVGSGAHLGEDSCNRTETTDAPMADAQETPCPPAEKPVTDDPAPEPVPEGFERVVLRQDGKLPLVLHALPVWRDETTVQAPSDLAQTLTRFFALYLTADGSYAAHAGFEPGDGVVARPAYRAALVADEFEFAQFLDACTPELCFAAAPSVLADATEICARIAFGKDEAPTPLNVPSTA